MTLIRFFLFCSLRNVNKKKRNEKRNKTNNDYNKIDEKINAHRKARGYHEQRK